MAITEFAVTSALVGGFIIIFGYVSLFIKEKLYLSEAFVASLVGLVFGPAIAGLILPNSWGNVDVITLNFTRVVIAVQVMAAGVALPKAYLWKEIRSLLVLLVPVMTWMWLISGLAIWLLIPGINLLEALVIAACVAPTDPVLANSIVKGRFAEKHVPPHVRNILSAESGANDGLGFPFLLLAVYLLKYQSVGEAIGRWMYMVLLYQIALSIVIGFVVGYVARKLLYYAKQRDYIDKESLLSFAVALAFFLLGTVSIIGSDDLLSCFIAGNSFTWDDWFRKETEDAHLQEVIDMLLNLSVFVYIGAVMPWSSFVDASLGLDLWRLIVIAVVILLFRRLPIILILYKTIPAIVTFREAVFSGYFGPIGVGAVFYAMVAKEELGSHGSSGTHAQASSIVSPVVFFLVLSSIILHGITIPLVHLGTRIATRTLTRNSNLHQENQVLRLPIIKLGQTFTPRANSSTVDTGNIASKTSMADSRSASPVESQASSDKQADEAQTSTIIDSNNNSCSFTDNTSRGPTDVEDSSSVQVIVFDEKNYRMDEDREGHVIKVTSEGSTDAEPSRATLESDSNSVENTSENKLPGKIRFAVDKSK
ncbi:uncharacterized protein VTP21DRAFT_10469 [Calcarisporiella thermophila]|uniref:uncharacterized protein n=1 Tax=Calcarisporiella thermophila TaxID=911321 RepID=UPI003744AB42